MAQVVSPQTNYYHQHLCITTRGEVLVERLNHVVISIFDLRGQISDCFDEFVERFFDGREFLGEGRECLFQGREDSLAQTAGGGVYCKSTWTTFLFRGRVFFSGTA